MGEALEFAEAEKLLLAAEFEDARPIWYSSNYVYLCQMCADGGQQFAAVYKPLDGENPLWDFPEGELYKREAAAYQLSQLLEWPFIPPTIVRDGPHGIGSLQLYINHNQESHFFTQREDPALLDQLKRMCVFDLISNNADRKGGHCLLDESGKVWGIDHGLCFHPQYKLRSVIWDWVDEPVPDEWLEDVKRAGTAIENLEDRAIPLIELIGEAQTAALETRMASLLKSRKFPRPGANRHYPWPLV
jgi:uncharacterized repeat protein (TIGR03843 family)